MFGRSSTQKKGSAKAKPAAVKPTAAGPKAKAKTRSFNKAEPTNRTLMSNMPSINRTLIQENAKAIKGLTIKRKGSELQVSGKKKDGTTEFAVYRVKGNEAWLLQGSSRLFVSMIERESESQSAKKSEKK